MLRRFSDCDADPSNGCEVQAPPNTVSVLCNKTSGITAVNCAPGYVAIHAGILLPPCKYNCVVLACTWHVHVIFTLLIATRSHCGVLIPLLAVSTPAAVWDVCCAGLGTVMAIPPMGAKLQNLSTPSTSVPHPAMCGAVHQGMYLSELCRCCCPFEKCCLLAGSVHQSCCTCRCLHPWPFPCHLRQFSSVVYCIQVLRLHQL
jgi:hypothetical protein